MLQHVQSRRWAVMSRYATSILQLIKPRQTLLLVLTLIAGYLAAGDGSLVGVFKAATIGFVAISATTAINMYLDRDIDLLMERTRKRPLAKGYLDPSLVLYSSFTILILSFLLGYLLVGTSFAVVMFAGFILNIVFYTILTKRRTPLSIVPGSLAGSTPILGGWLAGGGDLGFEGLSLTAVVLFWTPIHTLLLGVLFYRDYSRANIPVLPVVKGARATGVAVAASSLGLLAAVVMVHYSGLALYSTPIGALLAIYSMYAGYGVTRGMPRAKKYFVGVNLGLLAYLLGLIVESIYRYYLVAPR